MRPKRSNTPQPPNAFFIGGLIGAGVGYISALFLAKQEGEKTQKELKKKTQKVSHKALSQLESQLDNLQDKLAEEDMSEKGKPSRINVNVEERYEDYITGPEVDLKTEPKEPERI